MVAALALFTGDWETAKNEILGIATMLKDGIFTFFANAGTWLYQTGTWMVSGERLEGAAKPDFSEIFGHMLQALVSWDAAYILETAVPVFWPMFVSSLPTTFVVWWVFYLPLNYTIQGYQNRRFRNRSRTPAGNEKF